ncbi:MAG: tRNA (cytidine(34)-2'-O)-methyltransferase [Magnetococcales bacterium]|nr:tRNA (cytidine(34)-2'-O)-methyltransferase [Magnetococcales bacterium]
MHVILLAPEIPANTGNIQRLCAATASVLHLVGPLGFRLDHAGVKRAGMDYRDWSEVRRYRDWDHYLQGNPFPENTYALSTRGALPPSAYRFAAGDRLLFGAESRGLPEELLTQLLPRVVRIPMTPRARSLNLANSVAIVLYEALRQLDYPGLSPTDNSVMP